MQSQTAAELIDAGTGVVSALAKDFFVGRREREARKEELQMQKEIEMAKAGVGMENSAPGASGSDPDDPVLSALDEASEIGERYDDLLARAEAEEDCDLCRSLISAAREKPLREQKRLVPELRDLISSVEDDAPRQELVNTINANPALKQLLREHMSDLQSVAGQSDTPDTSPSGSTRQRQTTSRRNASPSDNSSGGSSPAGRQRTLRSGSYTG